MFGVPEPGVYGLVRSDGELWLWRNRRRDCKRSWPIWDAASCPIKKHTSDGTEFSAWAVYGPYMATADDVVFSTHYRPVRFGPVGPTNGDHALLHAEIDIRVWWPTDRKPPETRRAYYMPAMPRDALIKLVGELETRSATGVRQHNHKPIGVWIRRVWDVIERRERGDTFNVSP